MEEGFLTTVVYDPKANEEIQGMGNCDNAEAKVLWTGGWDSTFRVLSLSKTYHVTVHPYYLHDQGRKSVERELDVMRAIRDAVNTDGSGFLGTIAEPKIRDMEAMRNDSEIHDALLEIRRERHSGWQYYPLSSFVRQERLEGMELTAQKYDSLSIILDGMLEPFDTAFGTSYRVSERHKGKPEYTVFSPFTFPIIDVSKQEMKKRASDQRFLDLMESTWFCHSPLADGSPCGTCNPCIVSIREGMGYRVPLTTRLRYRTRTPRRMLWDLRKKLRRAFR